MAGFVKLAVAGAGKTTWLGKQVDPKKKNLLITFTNQNVANIEESVKNANNGFIPDNTQIMTYTKFLFYWVIKPNESFLNLESGQKLKGKGMTINEPAEFDYLNPKNGYVKDKCVRHYIDKYGYYYVSRLSKLFVKQNAKTKNLIENYIGLFVDRIYIDEFQDFINYDYKFILELVKGKNYDVHMVGDYYQSSVSSTNIKGKGAANSPYKKYEYDDFINQLEKKKIKVDTESLKKSWRCPLDTCQFISTNLKINILSKQRFSDYGIKIVTEKNAVDILKNDNIVKLLYNKNVFGYDKINNKNKWGYSKGNTYSNTCVILTKETSDFLLDTSKKVLESTQTKHMLYVALTRASKNTYLMKSDIYRKAIKNFLD